MRVYVIRDFAAAQVRLLLESLREIYTEHAGQPIEWDIPGLQAQGGQIARDIVYLPIRSTDHAIALLDNPNANVAWEVGLALGWGKSVRLVFFGGELPPWTQIGALKNLVLHHVRDVEDAAKLLAPLRWELAPCPLPPSKGGTLLLCPGGPEGSAARALARRNHPELGRLPDEGWSLYDVPALLGPFRRVIWIIASYPEKLDVRDGAENASNGVIAGLAEAWGREVLVLRSSSARVVADVQPREHLFGSLRELQTKLARLVAAGSGSITP